LPEASKDCRSCLHPLIEPSSLLPTLTSASAHVCVQNFIKKTPFISQDPLFLSLSNKTPRNSHCTCCPSLLSFQSFLNLFQPGCPFPSTPQKSPPHPPHQGPPLSQAGWLILRSRLVLSDSWPLFLLEITSSLGLQGGLLPLWLLLLRLLGWVCLSNSKCFICSRAQS